MIILAFDTCFGACSVALVRGEAILASEVQRLTRGHAEALLPMIERVLLTAKKSLDDIDRLAVTNGPGTFAGVRVGIATARALALATGKPVSAVGTLEAMAQTALNETPSLRSPFAVVRDARRDQVYAQGFRADGQRIISIMDTPVVCSPADVPALLAGPMEVAVGSGVGLVPWPTAQRPECHEAEIEVSAVAVGQLASRREASTIPISPLYLRAPDAKPQSGFALERQLPSAR